MTFTVCVLLYGDHPKMAISVLESLQRKAWQDIPIRIGCNAIGDVTRAYLDSYATRPIPTRKNFIFSIENIGKYPMMKRMFVEPITTDFVMWFDDDSRLMADAPDTFFDGVAKFMQDTRADMVGSLWTSPPMTTHQRSFYRDQPWYNHVPFGNRIPFITGGWWTIRTSILQKYSWPPADMGHNGGDVAMGMLCMQQKLKMARYEHYVAINADESGKCSSAKRRGMSEPPYGSEAWQKMKGVGEYARKR